MNILLDTNIIVDVLRKRNFDYESSRLLLALGKLHEFKLWISPAQLSDILYILTSGGKKRLAEPVKEELTAVLGFVTVCTFNHEDACAALNSSFSDLEDALIYQAARAVKAEAIITRNGKDFASSLIPALSSSEFFDWLAVNKNLHYAEIDL